MVKVIVKTSKAKVLGERDRLVAEANADKNLVGYSDEHVETGNCKYIFRVVPIVIPEDIFNQIYDLGDIEGEADISDILRTIQTAVDQLNKAVETVLKKPAQQELPVYTGNKIPDAPVAGVTETGETITPAQAVGKLQDMVDQSKQPAPESTQVKANEDKEMTPPDAQNAPQSPAPAPDGNSSATTPNPQP